MLQQRSANQVIMADLPRPSSPPTDMNVLERQVDQAIASLRAQRRVHGQTADVLPRLAARLDDWIRTDAEEFLDRADYADAGKVRIVSQLHRFNRVVQAYWRFLSILKPYIHAVHQQEKRTVNVLELASGSGEFTLALAEKARQQKLPIAIYGSDYIEAHVEEGNRKARAKGIAAQFRTINAFDMHNVAEGEFDIVFVAQTMHHFTPGQLAKMIAQASAKATYGFVGIDGRRGLELFGMMPLMAALNPTYGFMHDSFISMRKMYAEPELELIAQLAAPEHRVRTFSSHPGYSVLEVLHAKR